MISAILIMTGNILGRKMPERIKTLECVVLMIKTIRMQIEFSRMPVKELLNYISECSEFSRLVFINGTISLLKKTDDFELAWKTSLNKNANQMGIRQDDITMLIAFSAGLGNTDVSGQISNCDTYINLFEAKLDTLQKKSESSVRICNSLGVLSAALTAIILY